MTSFGFSKSSLKHREGIDTRLIEILDRAIEITVIDFGIPKDGGLRSAERQNELCLEGLSMCDGYVKPSNHQTGNAFDVYAYVDGKASWQSEHLAYVAAAILQASCELGYQLKWGGLWTSFVDMPHFELP